MNESKDSQRGSESVLMLLCICMYGGVYLAVCLPACLPACPPAASCLPTYPACTATTDQLTLGYSSNSYSPINPEIQISKEQFVITLNI
uniref:Uncharacterized protein n=1 Tax=Bracon brevicornis TaxID=1563983 RepID=A0A6V7LVU0_9HYME